MNKQCKSYLGPALVAHLDILGFQSKYNAISSTQELFELADKIESAFAKLPIGDDIHIRTFSDNIMIVKEIPGGLVDDRSLLQFIYICGKIQIFLLQNYEWVLRGGIAFGDHYHSDITIVGKPLVNAYTLESKKVIYPFVGIDAMNYIPKRCNEADTYRKSQNYNLIDLFSIDLIKKGFKVIDYLSIPILEAYFQYDSSESIYLKITQLLNCHSAIIIKNLNHATNPKIRKKYQILANYHNNFLAILKNKIDLIHVIQGSITSDIYPLILKLYYERNDFIISLDEPLSNHSLNP